MAEQAFSWDYWTPGRAVVFKTGDQLNGQDLYFFSSMGYLNANFSRKSDHNILRQTFYCDLNLYQLGFYGKRGADKIPPAWREYADVADKKPIYLFKEWNVVSGLNDIYNENEATHMRFGVARTRMVLPYGDKFEENQPSSYHRLFLPDDTIRIECDLVVQDKDDYLRGVGFRFNALVAFVGWAWK